MGAPRAEREIYIYTKYVCFAVAVAVDAVAAANRFKQRAGINESSILRVYAHNFQCTFRMCVECMLFHMRFLAIALNM